MVVLVVFVGTPLFAAEQAHTQPLQPSYNTAVLAISGDGDSGLPALSSPLGSADDFQSDIGVLDNDMDHDDHDDRAADSLAAVLSLVVAVVLSAVLLLIPLVVGGGLLLALCEPSKLSSVGVLVIERPG